MTDAPVFWFTGLSGAGKTTLAEAARNRLGAVGWRILILDGDQVREAFHRTLGFTPEDIRENNRLIAELCAQRRSACDAVLVPVISPFHDARDAARRRLSPGFYEVHVSADLSVVESRDVKGLYGKARDGVIGAMIGAPGGVPYEPPQRPDLRLHSASDTPAQSAAHLTAFIAERLAARAAAAPSPGG